MIITQDLKPDSQLYTIGASILEGLRSVSCQTIEAFDLYELVNKIVPLSLNTFFLGLDWLFLLGAVEERDGLILRCF